MSLKDFVSQPVVKERLRAEFPTPKLGAKPTLRAPLLSRNPSLIGTALDYLLRFYLERLNPGTQTREWVAEEAAFGEALIEGKIISLEEMVTKARAHQQDYLLSGTITDDLLASALQLAQLDVLRRREEIFWDNAYFENLGVIDPLDLSDLRQLISIVDPPLFRARSVCILNPTFGSASTLVGGADCDLVIDDMIIDIKTTKEASLQRSFFDQLLGYFFLSKLGAIRGAPPHHSINRVGIYYSRFGHLWTFDGLGKLSPSKMAELLTWFEKEARGMAPNV